MDKFIRQMVSTLLGEAMMPTGKDMIKTLFVVLSLTVIEVICALLKIPHIFSWQGCLLADVIVCLLFIIERSEYSAVSKLYRDVELRAKDIKERQQAISSSWKNGRTLRSNDELAGHANGRTNHESYSDVENE